MPLFAWEGAIFFEPDVNDFHIGPISGEWLFRFPIFFVSIYFWLIASGHQLD
jgi:hypothetical protein